MREGSRVPARRMILQKASPSAEAEGDACLLADQAKLTEIFIVLFAVFAIEDGVVALMEPVDIIVMTVHHRRVGLGKRVHAEVGALVRDTLRVDEDIEEHKPRVDRTLRQA